MIATRFGITVAAFFAAVLPTWATVTRVDVDFLEDVPNVQFDGQTLTIQHSSTLDSVTVFEDGLLTGFTNMSFFLTTTYSSVLLTSGGFHGGFRDGSYALTFSDGVNEYKFNGLVNDLILSIGSATGGANPSTLLTGEFVFTPLVVNLPANPIGLWAALGSTHVQFLTKNIFVEEQLDDSFWINPTPWSSARSDGWSFINAIPEPGMFVLLTVASLGICRKARPRNR